MNWKIKSVVMAALILVAVASVIYLVPTFAYINGDADQTRDRDRDMDKIRNRDYICDLTRNRDQNQTRACLHLQGLISNSTSVECMTFQYQWQNNHRHQNMLAP